MTELFLDEVASPLGPIVIAWHGDALRALYFLDRRDRMLSFFRGRFGEFELREKRHRDFRARIARYFEGNFNAFDGAALDPGGTPFQKRVWDALLEIPPGQTATYGGIAERIGSPAACRAVGLANGLNPISIVIPCHRVVGSNGKLTGYGGGLDRKQWLLQHEGGSSRQSGLKF
jgi:methylated-DNA-[protein]-cysteine S-methyltransferase